MKKTYLYIALVFAIAFACKKESDTTNTAMGKFSFSFTSKILSSTKTPFDTVQSFYYVEFSLKKFQGDTLIRDTLVKMTKGVTSYRSDSVSLTP